MHFRGRRFRGLTLTIPIHWHCPLCLSATIIQVLTERSRFPSRQLQASRRSGRTFVVDSAVRCNPLTSKSTCRPEERPDTSHILICSSVLANLSTWCALLQQLLGQASCRPSWDIHEHFARMLVCNIMYCICILNANLNVCSCLLKSLLYQAEFLIRCGTCTRSWLRRHRVSEESSHGSEAAPSF